MLLLCTLRLCCLGTREPFTYPKVSIPSTAGHNILHSKPHPIPRINTTSLNSPLPNHPINQRETTIPNPPTRPFTAKTSPPHSPHSPPSPYTPSRHGKNEKTLAHLNAANNQSLTTKESRETLALISKAEEEQQNSLTAKARKRRNSTSPI